MPMVINEKYQVIAKLGDGGSGETYLVQKDGELYALKCFFPIISRESCIKIGRDYEASIHLSLKQNNILDCKDIGEFILEYPEIHTLIVLKRKPSTVPDRQYDYDMGAQDIITKQYLEIPYILLEYAFYGDL